MTVPTPTELEGLLERASVKRLIADTHHTRDYAGREHGFLRCEGELVPLAGFVLRVEGMPQDQGAARLRLVAAAVNALPSLLARIKELSEALEEAEAIAIRGNPLDIGFRHGPRTRKDLEGDMLSIAATARATLTLNRSENDG